MKKFLLIGLIVLSSCQRFQNKQQRAEHLVKLYLDSSLNDAKSYENIKFSKLDTIWGGYMETKEGKELFKKQSDEMDSIKYLQNQQEIVVDAKYYDNKLFNQLKKKVDRLLKQNKIDLDKVIDLQTKIKGPFMGYRLINTYRAKNGFGALGVHQTKFEVDSSISKIISVKEVGD